MPIYEYQCSSCAHRVEKLQKISDGPLVDCPNCLKPALKKLVSAAAFRLKGSGWYETDFKTGSKKNVSGDSNVGSSTGSGSAAGSEAKADSTAAKDPAPASTTTANSQ